MFRFSFVALATLLRMQSVVCLEVGDQLCIQGFIMDYFCIKSVNMIDNGRATLEEPETHSVHCLVDVGICLNSAFEVLISSTEGSTQYSRGYRLDDDSKSDIIDLARSVGSCSTCVNGYDSSMLSKGFKAVMKATVLDMSPNDSESAPPLIRVDERKDASSLGNDPCQSEYGMVEGVPSGSTSPPVNPPTPPPSMEPVPLPTRGPTVPQTPAPDGSTESVASPTMSPNGSPTAQVEMTDSAISLNLLWSLVISVFAMMIM